MSYKLLIAFLSASSIIAFIPGPTVLLIANYAIRYGRWSGRYTIPAAIVGDIAALTLTFTGLGAILKTFPEYFSILKIAGGIYMIILGITSLSSNTTIEKENTYIITGKGRPIFMHVFLITALNPKTILFFLAFFPLFIDPTLSTTKQMLIMGTIFVILGAASAVFYDFCAAKINGWLKSPSSIKIIHNTIAIILCTLGFGTIFFL